MSKKLIHKYTFDASAKSIVVNDVIGQSRFLTITNVTTNQIIFAFADDERGAASFTQDLTNKTTTLVLDYDTTSMSDTDKLQIFIEKDSTEMRPDKTYTDPVSKFRVSQPQNLIDTDFEYGLQNTKWETLELIKNIPTFFSRNGDTDLDVSTITTTANSNLVTVVTTIDHELVQGNPIIVQGTARSTCNGGFVVTTIVNATTFQYAAKAEIPITQNIKETYTQIFLGSIYQGTEFKLANIDGIVTNNANPSKLTVQTDFPLGFNNETSFFLTNSVGQKVVNFNSANTTFENFANRGKSTTVNVPTGEVNSHAIGAVDTWNWQPIHNPAVGLNVKWFVQGTGGTSTITVNTAGGVETITFTDGPHGFADDDYVVYWHGDGNGAMGGLTDTRPYYVNVVDANTIYLSTSLNGGRVNLSNHGTFAGVSRSCFVTAFDPTNAYTASAQEQLRFANEVPLIAADRSQAVIMNYTTTGGLPYMNNSDNLATYEQPDSTILYTKNVTVAGGRTTCQFAYTPNGATRNINSGTVNGAMVLIELNPTRNSIWYANHGLQDMDLIRFGSSSSSVPSGLTRNQYYTVQVVNDNRIRFRQYNQTSIRELSSQGSVSATVDFTGYSYQDGADYLDGTQTITQAAETVTYVVTVNPKASDPAANAFYINGQEADTLELREGSTYTFDVSDASAAGHPLKFSTTADGTHGGGSEYTTGITVSGTQGDAGATVTFVVPSSTAQLYYYCSVHAGMGGIANTPAPTTTTQGHGLSEGDAVVYTDESGTTIGGLSNAGSYYVAQPTTNTLQLSTTATGFSGSDVTVNNATSGNNTAGYLYNYDYVRKSNHGFSTGDRVQYTSSAAAVGGLRNGGFYYIRVINTTYFYVYRTLAGAQSNAAWPDRIRFGLPYSGTSRFRQTDIVDLTAAGTGTQKLTASVAGASDGVYNISNVVDSNTFEMQASGQIPTRVIAFDPASSVYIESDAIRIADHFFRSGYAVTYNEGTTATGGLVDGTVYYVIRNSKNWIHLAATYDDAIDGTAITLTSQGVGQATLSTNNLIGEVKGQGTVSIDNETVKLNGSNTNFTSFFKTGDNISLYEPEAYTERTISSMDDANDTFDTSVNHGFTDGDLVIYEATTSRTGLTSGVFYYIKTVDANTLSLYPTNADAVAGTNKIAISGTGSSETLKKLTSTGSTIEVDVATVLSPTKINLSEPVTSTLSDIEYSVGTSLLLRSDGFALHRPFDGGVELIPSTNPDSQMIRQTRKYFRYQSGKGIQVSFAVNFSPTVPIERITTTGGNKYGYIYTKFPHRLSVDLPITVRDVPTIGGLNYFNKSYLTSQVVDDYQVRIAFPEVEITGSQSGTTLTVTSTSEYQDNATLTGLIAGMSISTPTPTKIVRQLTGTTGSLGTYEVDISQTVSSGTFTASYYPLTSTSTGGYGHYEVDSWNNSHLRCGLFDDQNGMFFEYDGQDLYVCRRKSIKQLSGSVSVTFGSGAVTGTNTKFSTQAQVGGYLVIRGQSYLVTKISDDNNLNIAPSYRGASANNVIVTITETIRVPQSQWNIDTADGNGPTGYVLDIHTIQMAYIDYSWYGAGKIRFGFKDQEGDVQYVHAFIHNNLETEAYMRSGNMPARYDIQNVGKPTYVPALAHWGTSVIMDGRYDDDKAYIFTASSNDVQVTGAATVSVTGRVAYRSNYYYGLVNNRLRRIGWALETNQSSSYNQLTEGQVITGANLQSNTKVVNPQDNNFPQQPYLPDILSSQGYSYSGQSTRNLVVIDKQPSTTAGSDSTYTVTLSAASTPVNIDVPLITVRLAPSVDTNTIGNLGEREIINRMQLILNSVGILSTHAAEVSLRLNGQVDNVDWNSVQNPSLSQLVFHGTGDSITGGTDVYRFRVQGGTGTSSRQPVLTTEQLAEVATLGNAIMGGDNTFPDGPDIVTVVVRLTEDPSTVSASNPFNSSARISWSESQA
jgi:hypothetical protein